MITYSVPFIPNPVIDLRISLHIFTDTEKRRMRTMCFQLIQYPRRDFRDRTIVKSEVQLVVRSLTAPDKTGKEVLDNRGCSNQVHELSALILFKDYLYRLCCQMSWSKRMTGLSVANHFPKKWANLHEYACYCRQEAFLINNK